MTKDPRRPLAHDRPHICRGRRRRRCHLDAVSVDRDLHGLLSPRAAADLVSDRRVTEADTVPLYHRVSLRRANSTTWLASSSRRSSLNWPAARNSRLMWGRGAARLVQVIDPSGVVVQNLAQDLLGDAGLVKLAVQVLGRGLRELEGARRDAGGVGKVGLVEGVVLDQVEDAQGGVLLEPEAAVDLTPEVLARAAGRAPDAPCPGRG